MRIRFYFHVALWCALCAVFLARSIPIVGPAVLENKIGPVDPNHSTDSYLSGLTHVRNGSELFSNLIVLVFVAVIYLLIARNFSRLLLAIGVLGPIILYSLTYVFSALPSYTAHVTSSLPRLLLHVTPPAWLAVGLALPIAKTETEKLESKRG